MIGGVIGRSDSFVAMGGSFCGVLMPWVLGYYFMVMAKGGMRFFGVLMLGGRVLLWRLLVLVLAGCGVDACGQLFLLLKFTL